MTPAIIGAVGTVCGALAAWRAASRRIALEEWTTLQSELRTQLEDVRAQLAQQRERSTAQDRRLTEQDRRLEERDKRIAALESEVAACERGRTEDRRRTESELDGLRQALTAVRP